MRLWSWLRQQHRDRPLMLFACWALPWSVVAGVVTAADAAGWSWLHHAIGIGVFTLAWQAAWTAASESSLRSGYVDRALTVGWLWPLMVAFLR